MKTTTLSPPSPSSVSVFPVGSREGGERGSLLVPLVIAYGGGVNSTAMLCGLREREIKPDLILFADTKGEHQHTYRHLEELDALCRVWWGIPIITVRKLYQGQHERLEQNCIRKKMLPSLAYGKKACSMKYKVEPQNQYVKRWMDDGKITRIRKAIGYHADEGHRAVGKLTENMKRGRMADFWYPLIEWQWRQSDCVDAIKRHGLTPPKKSACFFCPATKRGEIIRMRIDHPAEYARAIEIERNAINKTPGRGLGGSSLLWQDLAAADDAQAQLWDWVDANAPTPTPCGCYDG